MFFNKNYSYLGEKMTLVYILIFFICPIPDNNKTTGLQFNATDDFEC